MIWEEMNAESKRCAERLSLYPRLLTAGFELLRLVDGLARWIGDEKLQQGWGGMEHINMLTKEHREVIHQALFIGREDKE